MPYNNLHGQCSINFHLKKDSVLLNSQKITWYQVLHFKIITRKCCPNKLNYIHFGLLFDLFKVKYVLAEKEKLNLFLQKVFGAVVFFLILIPLTISFEDALSYSNWEKALRGSLL